MHTKPGMVLVPFPLTPLCVFAYYLYRRWGCLDENVGARFTDLHGEAKEKHLLANGFICNFGIPKLHRELEARLALCSDADRPLLMRYMQYCRSGDNQKKYDKYLARWLAEMSRGHLNDPKAALKEASIRFANWLTARLDPWKDTLPLTPHIGKIILPPAQFVWEPRVKPSDGRLVTLPIFKPFALKPQGLVERLMRRLPMTHRIATRFWPDTDYNREVIDSTTIELWEGNIWDLVGSGLTIVIGGPPNSGKSTFTRALVGEVRAIVQTLQTRSAWDDFALNVECIDLDLATPTTEGIGKRAWQDAKKHEAQKRPWTMDLAYEAYAMLAQAKARADLVFADLPGKVTEITEVVGAQADGAILLSRDWDLMPAWKLYCKGLGIPVVSQARSRMEDDGKPSVVMTYKLHKRISGRVVGLNRMVRSWDPFISWLAEFLVFDILPHIVSERQKKLDDLLRT